jgi:hypothetical protein
MTCIQKGVIRMARSIWGWLLLTIPCMGCDQAEFFTCPEPDLSSEHPCAEFPEGSVAEAKKAVGDPCNPPPEGVADLTGQASGVAPPASQKAIFQNISTAPTILIDEQLDRSGDCALEDVAVRIVLYSKSTTLGAHPLAPGKATVELFGDGLDAALSASSGQVTLDGYDPTTNALCGTVDVTFAEGEKLSGAFQSVGSCP